MKTGNPHFGRFSYDDEPVQAKASISPNTVAPGYTGRVLLTHKEKMRNRKKSADALYEVYESMIRTYCTVCGEIISDADPKTRKCQGCVRSNRKGGDVKYCRFCGEEMLKSDYFGRFDASVMGWSTKAAHESCQQKREEVRAEARKELKKRKG